MAYPGDIIRAGEAHLDKLIAERDALRAANDRMQEQYDEVLAINDELRAEVAIARDAQESLAKKWLDANHQIALMVVEENRLKSLLASHLAERDQARAEVERLENNLTALDACRVSENRYLLAEQDNLRALVAELVDELDGPVLDRYQRELIARARAALEGK